MFAAIILIMGVRRIPIGTRTLTGYFFSFKNQGHVEFESLLERDFYLSLEFVVDVLSYKAQPVKVEKRINGRIRPLYPDCLVTFTRLSDKRPLLVEVKHTKDLNNPKKADEIKVKVSVMEEFAKRRCWDFRLVTDKDVRGVRLENYRFLYKYTEPPAVLPEYRKAIMDRIGKRGPASVAKLMEDLFQNKTERVRALPCVWHLVRKGQLLTGLDRPLTNSSIMEVRNA